MKDVIRWGIVGLGNIAHKFADDLALIKDAKLTAVASRSLDRAKEFAKEHTCSLAFGNYDELFESDEVDVIYIATPHDSHADLSIKAMGHGKHILCEKPLGVNSKQVHDMVRTARENKVFLMEAMWSRFNPSIQKVKQLIDENTIGAIHYIHADFAFYALGRSEEGRLLNPKLAGGALLDIGIYPIFLAYLILGKPDSIQAKSNFYKTGVEIQTSMLFHYKDAQAVLYCGLNATSEMKAEIAGTKGSLYLHPRWHETQGYTLELENEQQHHELPTLGLGYTHEIQEVHTCLREGQLESSLWSHENSSAMIAIMDEVRRQSGIRFPFE